MTSPQPSLLRLDGSPAGEPYEEVLSRILRSVGLSSLSRIHQFQAARFDWFVVCVGFDHASSTSLAWMKIRDSNYCFFKVADLIVVDAWDEKIAEALDVMRRHMVLDDLAQ